MIEAPEELFLAHAIFAGNLRPGVLLKLESKSKNNRRLCKLRSTILPLSHLWIGPNITCPDGIVCQHDKARMKGTWWTCKDDFTDERLMPQYLFHLYKSKIP